MRSSSLSISFIAVLLLTFGVGCAKKERPQKIDLRERSVLPTEAEAEDVLGFGVSGSQAPQHIYRRYAPLADYLGKRTGHKVKLVQRRTYHELNELLEEGELDLAWLATGAYVGLVRRRDIELLALPSRDEKPYHQGCIIVHGDSPVNQFGELSGKSFAFVDSLSIAGYYYPAYLLSEMGSDINGFFSKTFFTGGHDKSLRLVLNRDVDGASVSCQVLYGSDAKNYGIKSGVKVIQKSPSLGMGPVVVRNAMPPELKGRLKEALFNMHRDEAAKHVLEAIGVDRFIQGDDSDYAAIREMIRAVAER